MIQSMTAPNVKFCKRAWEDYGVQTLIEISTNARLCGPIWEGHVLQILLQGYPNIKLCNLVGNKSKHHQVWLRRVQASSSESKCTQDIPNLSRQNERRTRATAMARNCDVTRHSNTAHTPPIPKPKVKAPKGKGTNIPMIRDQVRVNNKQASTQASKQLSFKN